MRAFSPISKLDPDIADALYELGNVGVGQATSALGNMTGKRITIGTPSVFSAELGLSDFAGLPPDAIVMGILMRLANNLGGAVLILISKEFMENLVYSLTGVHYSDDALIEDEDSLSIIQEVANIMASSYMNAIGAYTGLRIYMTPVMVGVDMVAALISYPITELSLSSENIICIDTSFYVAEGQTPETRCDGRIVMLPDEASVQILTDALRL